jgi:hypothetical protein
LAKSKGLFIWLAEHPNLVLALGGFSTLVFLALSMRRGNWSWFPRGGALMALSGFIVSVQEALKFRPSHPKLVSITQEARDKILAMSSVEREKSLSRVLKGEDDPLLIVIPADPGYKMRDLGEMTSAELSLLRFASIFGVLGTFIWAFGDLVPRLTHILLRAVSSR